jgi:hypothetical protein
MVSQLEKKERFMKSLARIFMLAAILSLAYSHGASSAEAPHGAFDYVR